jgi:hypothetical protein
MMTHPRRVRLWNDVEYDVLEVAYDARQETFVALARTSAGAAMEVIDLRGAVEVQRVPVELVP